MLALAFGLGALVVFAKVMLQHRSIPNLSVEREMIRNIAIWILARWSEVTRWWGTYWAKLRRDLQEYEGRLRAPKDSHILPVARSPPQLPALARSAFDLEPGLSQPGGAPNPHRRSHHHHHDSGSSL